VQKKILKIQIQVSHSVYFRTTGICNTTLLAQWCPLSVLWLLTTVNVFIITSELNAYDRHNRTDLGFTYSNCVDKGPLNS
jgi:hypothetical protein